MNNSMITADQIKIQYGFDVVGVVKEPGKNIIVLGLETKPERNLDEFIGGNEELENWCFSGHKKYFSPKIDKLLIELEKIDPKTKPIPGYSDDIELKELAIKAGIGTQGRSTLVINPLFQSRLRFVAVETYVEIESTGSGIYSRVKNSRCEECRLCEMVCPKNVLKDYKLIDKNKCIAFHQLVNRTPNLRRCSLCWEACTRNKYWVKEIQTSEKEITERLLPKNENLSDK